MNLLSSRVQSLEEAKSSEQSSRWSAGQRSQLGWVDHGALDRHYEALARATNSAGEMPEGEAQGLQPAITGGMSRVSPFQPLQGRSALLGASQGQASRGLLGPIVQGNLAAGGNVGNPWLRMEIPHYRIDSPIQRAVEDPPHGQGPVGQVSEGSASAQESFHSFDLFGPSDGLGMGSGAPPAPSAPPGIPPLPPLPLPSSVQTSVSQGLEIGRGLRWLYHPQLGLPIAVPEGVQSIDQAFRGVGSSPIPPPPPVAVPIVTPAPPLTTPPVTPRATAAASERGRRTPGGTPVPAGSPGGKVAFGDAEVYDIASEVSDQDRKDQHEAPERLEKYVPELPVLKLETSRCLNSA